MSRFLRRATETAPALDIRKDVDSAASTPPPVSQEIITRPSLSTCKLPPPFEPTYEQAKIMAEIKEHLLDLHRSLVEGSKNGDEHPPSSSSTSYIPWERRWIEDPSTARRYANAVKWDLAQAKKRASDTLYWRREFKPDLLVPDEVKREGETGKHIVSGFDNLSRPVLYLRPGRENTEPNVQQVRYLVWSLERAIDFCPEGQDKICLLIDYSKATQHTQPSFATQKSVLNILQNHYPERLGKAIVCNVPVEYRFGLPGRDDHDQSVYSNVSLTVTSPLLSSFAQWILSSFFTFISPFLDPNTRAKIAMLRSPDNVKDSIPLDMLDADFGGTWRYQFHFDSYWSTLLDFCGIAPDGTRTHPTKARPSAQAISTTSPL